MPKLSPLLKPRLYYNELIRRWSERSIEVLEKRKDRGLDINFTENPKSNVKIDIVIPSIDKDCETLGYVLDSIRKFIRHPIGKIFIISPANSTKIKQLCLLKNCVFVDEDTLLPITKKDISYSPSNTEFPSGLDRSGWVFQQLLKWAADRICDQEYFLITESDTIFIRPRIFEFRGKIIIPCCTDPCHLPYFHMYQQLLGQKITPIYNFTSHHSLFQKKILQKLKNDIEQNCGVVWYMAIIKNLDPHEMSSTSDYENYGQYLYSHYRNKVILEHWFNLSMPRRDLKNVAKLAKENAPNYKAISFHSYND